MGLRLKMLSGFLILTAMLFLAGLWSVYELNYLSTSVQDILDENYESIEAAKLMNEALEREDSAVLILLLGRTAEGQKIMHKADSTFSDRLNFAYSNITIPGEKESLDLIRERYLRFKEFRAGTLSNEAQAEQVDWYFNQVHQSFLSVKDAVNQLINLNDRTMYNTASRIRDKARSSMMPGLTALVAALVFTFLFNYLIHVFIIDPILLITDRVKKFREKGLPYDVRINSKDEIYYLSGAIEELCYIAELDRTEK